MLTTILFIFLFNFLSAFCPENSFKWQSKCFFFNSNATGFAEAEANCVQNGTQLVSIHDGFTNTLLAEEACKYFHQSTVTDCWIGLTDLIASKNWTWMDKSILDFTNWASGEPKNTTGNNCAVLTLADGLWRTEDCFISKPYICSVDESYYIPPTTPFPSFVPCQWPLIYFQPTHSCYGVNSWDSRANAVTWENAEKFCESIFKGHLVSIHSKEELHFFTSFEFTMASEIWSGLKSDDYGLTWKWSDGSPYDFPVPWATGYPKGNSCCTYVTDVFYNAECNILKRTLCKVKL
uniref:C-type lectin domain-containing protein n=1 Tax=Panagrolaimus davidi TaxID=227884 RepID=A0A914QEU1_9BILA